MKKFCFSLAFLLVFMSSVIGIKAQDQTSAFAGDWVLDRGKTNTQKDFPEKLKNYKMTVSGTASSLKVKNQIEGNVEIKAAGQGARTPVTESASMLGTRQTATDTSSANTGTGKINYGGTMAIFFTPNEAVYNVNGEEVKIETPQGLVRVRAKPDKSGKSMQFTIIRRMKTQTGEMEVIAREVWKLSEDGKSLKLLRTVETPGARDEITMILNKVNL